MLGYDVDLLILSLAKTVTPGGSPRRGVSGWAAPLNIDSLLQGDDSCGAEVNCIYWPVGNSILFRPSKDSIYVLSSNNCHYFNNIFIYSKVYTVRSANAPSIALFYVIHRFKGKWSLGNNIKIFKKRIKVFIGLRQPELLNSVMMDSYQIFFSQKILAVRRGNDIQRPVMGSAVYLINLSTISFTNRAESRYSSASFSSGM